MIIKPAQKGVFSLIKQNEQGEIIQIGISETQSNILQFFLASLSNDKAFIEMPKEYNLKLNNVSKICLHSNRKVTGGNQTRLTCIDCGKDLV